MRIHRGWLGGRWLIVLLLLTNLAATNRLSPLADAAERQDLSAIARLLKQRADVNAPQPDGTTALHWAVRWSLTETTTLLLRSGANANAANRYQVTPLALACINGTADIVNKLLAAGARVNDSPNGESPLMLAARTGDVETVQALISSGADVTVRDREKGQTALMWAAAEGNASVVRLLSESGADVSAHSKGGFSPLLFAVRKGDQETVGTLIAAGADPNEMAPDGSPLTFVGITNAHYELTAFLLDQGADPNKPDKTGRTALHALISARNTYGDQFLYIGPPAPTGSLDPDGLIKVLIAHGANPNARIHDVETARSAVVVQADPPQKGDPQARNGGAVKSGPDPIDTQLNMEGATPFFLAAQNADSGAMRVLASSGADPRLSTIENTTPLMVAAGLGSRPRRAGPAAAAVLEAVQLAVELGNQINAANDHGQTALHGAAYRGADDAIKFLVTHGASLTATDERGRTPADLADGFLDSQGVVKHETSALLFRQLANR